MPANSNLPSTPSNLSEVLAHSVRAPIVFTVVYLAFCLLLPSPAQAGHQVGSQGGPGPAFTLMENPSSPGCPPVCSCYWKVSTWIWSTPPVQVRNGNVARFRQSAALGEPSMEGYVYDASPGPRSVGGFSDGWMIKIIEHLDECPQCPANRWIAGGSRPVTRFDVGRLDPTAEVQLTASLVTRFSQLNAGNQLNVRETYNAASQQFQGSVTFTGPRPTLSVAGPVVTVTLLNRPVGRYYWTAPNTDGKRISWEHIRMGGTIQTRLMADGWWSLVVWDQAWIGADLSDSTHNMAVLFNCRCHGGHTSPPASLPPTSVGVPMPGPGSGGGTTPPAGAGTGYAGTTGGQDSGGRAGAAPVLDQH